MVKALHENRMEVVMQFYFPNGMTQVEILEILRFWRVVYHVDGFHLMGNGLPIKDAASDVFLQFAVTEKKLTAFLEYNFHNSLIRFIRHNYMKPFFYSSSFSFAFICC